MPMLGILGELAQLEWLIKSPIALLGLAFQIWMLVDAVRRREWIWVFFLLIGYVFSAFWYFLMVYRGSETATTGFELPGASNRKRIRELEAKIHHLGNAAHHSELGDVYFQQGKLEKAEACYRKALEKDSKDLDTLSHFAQCLLRSKRASEARPLLERVVAENPRHDYGYTQMALAEAQAQLGDSAAAIASWRAVLAHNSYARARVQLAELLIPVGQAAEAASHLRETISDDAHAPAFLKGRDRIWVRRAKGLLKSLPTG
jgi:hypothetical protein